jgi:hypothetical protein
MNTPLSKAYTPFRRRLIADEFAYSQAVTAAATAEATGTEPVANAAELAALARWQKDVLRAQRAIAQLIGVRGVSLANRTLTALGAALAQIEVSLTTPDPTAAAAAAATVPDLFDTYEALAEALDQRL